MSHEAERKKKKKSEKQSNIHAPLSSDMESSVVKYLCSTYLLCGFLDDCILIDQY